MITQFEAFLNSTVDVLTTFFFFTVLQQKLNATIHFVPSSLLNWSTEHCTVCNCSLSQGKLNQCQLSAFLAIQPSVHQQKRNQTKCGPSMTFTQAFRVGQKFISVQVSPEIYQILRFLRVAGIITDIYSRALLVRYPYKC